MIATPPWGRDERGRVIAPFGIARDGRPRRRMPGGKLTGGMSGFKTPITEAIEQRLAALDCDPIAILAEIALKQSNDASIRMKPAAEFAIYCYAARRRARRNAKENW